VAVRFALEVQLKPGRSDDVRRGYEALRERLAQGVPGLRAHQLCEDADDELHWLITSEWDDAESNQAWESSDEHRALTMPLRDCWESAKRSHFEVRSEYRP